MIIIFISGKERKEKMAGDMIFEKGQIREKSVY